ETPEGVFTVYSEQPNGWWKGELGELYRPKFFKGGSAIHGAPKVPNFPASHGCVRVTPEAMDFIWSQNFMPKGGTVWVHAWGGGRPRRCPPPRGRRRHACRGRGPRTARAPAATADRGRAASTDR